MELTGKFNENYIDEQTGERVKAAVADLSEEQCYELARKMLETLANNGSDIHETLGKAFNTAAKVLKNTSDHE